MSLCHHQPKLTDMCVLYCLPYEPNDVYASSLKVSYEVFKIFSLPYMNIFLLFVPLLVIIMTRSANQHQETTDDQACNDAHGYGILLG